MSVPTNSIPTNEPQEVDAGDRVQWTRELSDWSAADSFVLTYYLILADATSAKETITAAGSGTTHTVDEAPATTAAWAAGIYRWRAYVDDGTTRCLIDSGTLKVHPDFEILGATDQRTHAKVTLDAIEAVIEGRATESHMAYSIAGRQLSKIPLSELTAFRDQYRGEVVREERADAQANGGGQGGKIKMRF